MPKKKTPSTPSQAAAIPEAASPTPPARPALRMIRGGLGGDTAPESKPTRRKARPRSPLETLGLEGLETWSMRTLAELSVAELLALPNDLGEQDPALSMLRHLSNDLVALGLAVGNPEANLTPEDLQITLHRLSLTALSAAEIHRRVLADLRR